MISLNTIFASPHGYTTASDFISNQCRIYAERPLARYFVNNRYETLTYFQVDHLATNLASKWSQQINVPIVSLIGGHDIDYFIILIALMKLRITVLLISPRNSVAANINLLEKTGSKLLIANTKLETIAKASIDHVPGGKLLMIEAMDIETLLKHPLVNHLKTIKPFVQELENTALIFHSSGSTNYPKPIYISNRYLLCAFHIFYGQMPINTFDADDVLLTCTPLSHIFGLCSIFAIMSIGASVVIIKKLPPSQEEVDFALSYNKCTIFVATPVILEEMIPYLEKKQDFTTIERIKVSFAGGAPLKRESGILLHQRGLKLSNSYGSTEAGPTMGSGMDFEKDWTSMYPFIVDSEGMPYAKFEIDDIATPHIKHCYIRGESPLLATGICNRADGGYSTNDLFTEDPASPGYYIYLGRRDDILIMENGEKTNPIPMEAALLESNVISKAVVLGHGRQCTAALIELDIEFSKSTTDEIQVRVQEAIERANQDCPNHSKLFTQMVKILPLNEHLPVTVKGAVIRHKSVIEYKEYIDQLYNDFLQGPTRASKSDVSTWTCEKIETFLVDSTAKVLGLTKPYVIDKHQSLFYLGLDSLTAIQLRNKIGQCFDNLPLDFIFQNQSIFEMSQSLSGKQLGDQYQQTQDLAQHYINKAKFDFPEAEHRQENKPTIILLTGVTGSLGSFILQDLLQRKQVEKIYCLIRGQNIKDRLYHAFESRSLDVSLLNTDRIQLLPYVSSDSMLGLTAQVYKQLKKDVTIVQHCGWLLDFNMPIGYFDKECIAPFYNIVKFAYRPVNPMQLHFISSVSASALLGGTKVPEQPLSLDASVSLPMGYAQSKFVIEALFTHLCTEKNFPCYIERLGQVCGDTRHGVWNVSEQFPMMFMGGASVMHKMPDLDMTIDWIPVDFASAFIVDIMLSSADSYIYHIVNPNVIYWSDVLGLMKEAGMEFDIVSLNDWVQELALDETNPCYRLLGFFEAKSKNSITMPIWETEKTVALIPGLNNTPVLDVDLFKKFLLHWESVGYYNPSI